MTRVRIHARGRLMLTVACAAPVLVVAGALTGHLLVSAFAAAGSIVWFGQLVHGQRELARQARWDARRQRRQRQRRRRFQEPEMWLSEFRQELAAWDMTVESLLAKAGPEPPAGYVHATSPRALYDQDEDGFGDPL